MAYVPLTLKKDGTEETGMPIPNSYVPLVKQSEEYRSKIQQDIERDKAAAPVPQEDKGLLNRVSTFFGKTAKTIKTVGEGFKEAWPAGILQAASALEASLGVGLDKMGQARGTRGEIKLFRDVGQKLKQKAIQDLDLAETYAKVNLPVLDQKTFLENIKDPQWLGRGIGMNAPNLMVSLGVSAAVAAATKNPAAGIAAGFGTSFGLEGGSAYNEAIRFGLDEDEAVKAGSVVGVINGLLDVLPIGRIISRFPAGKEIKKKILREVTKSVLKQTALESSTESLQEIVSNAIAQTYNSDQKLFEGVVESAFFGGLMGGGVGLVTDIGAAVVSKPETEMRLTETPAETIQFTQPEAVEEKAAEPEQQKRMGPAEFAAQRIVRRLEGDEFMAKTETGRELLKKRLTREEAKATKSPIVKLAEAVEAELLRPKKTPETVTKVKTLPRGKKVAKTGIPKELELLAQEARKYKSAEEFVRAKTLTKEQQISKGAGGHLGNAIETEIPLSKIDGREPVPVMEGGYKKGTEIKQPIEVQYNPETDTYTLYAGNHRVRQAEINGQKTIKAFVEDSSGKTKSQLTDFYNQATGKEVIEKAKVEKAEPKKIAEADEREQLMAELAKNEVSGTYFEDLPIEELRKEVEQYKTAEESPTGPSEATPELLEEKIKARPAFELTAQFKKEKGIVSKPGKGRAQRIAAPRDVKNKVADILKLFTGKRLPILQSIGFKGTAAMATDLEVGVMYRLGKDVGSLALPAEQLKGRNLEELVIDEKGRTATIGGLEIQGQPIDEFPVIPEVKAEPQFAVSYESLESGLSQMLDHVATTDTRPELNGILLKNENGQLRITATDSFRLNQVSIGAKIEKDFEVILPLNAAKKVLRLFKQVKPDMPIEVAIDKKENQIQFKSGPVTVVSRTIDGSYPDYKKIIPGKAKIVTTFSKTDLLAVIKEAPKTSLNDIQIHYAKDGKSVQIKVVNKAEGVSFSKSIPAQVVKKEVKINPDKDIYLVMPLREAAKDTKIALNREFVSDYLNNVDSYEIELLDTDESNAPILLREAEAGYQIAFSDQTSISPEQVSEVVRRYFTPEEVGVNFVEQILTPNGLKALGRYSHGMITFVKNPDITTPEHEVLHAYFDLFTSPEDKTEILDLVKAQYSLATDEAASERLADDFVDYVRGKRTGFISQTLDFFRMIWKGIKALFGKGNKVQALFDDIVNLQRKNEFTPEGTAKFQLDLSEFSPEEQQVINLLQDGQDVPDNLAGAVASLQSKGVIKPAIKTPPVKQNWPLIKLEQGERVSRRGITISRSRQAISRPYRVSYETGDKYVVKTFPTAEDASRRFSAMVELRDKGFARAGELSPELQATNQQKAQAHLIAEKKHVTPSQFKRLEKIYTGVDSMTKMTPEKGAEFINVLKSIKPKFGGLISISRSTEIVKAEDAERKFHNTTIGWLLDIFRSPANVFRKIGVYDQAKPLFDAFSARGDYIESVFEHLANWQKELGITKFGSLLTRRKEVADQTRRMFRAINNPDANVQLSEKEGLIVDRAKELTNEIADLIDEARKETGLQPMNRRENYITNLLTEESHYLIQNTKQAPNELYALLDIKMPSNVFDRLLLERKGGLPIKEDFWKALKVMTQVHSKYIYLNPPVHRFERFMRYWGDKIPALSRKYIQGRLNRFLGRPGLIERFLKGVDESITKVLMNVPGLSKEVKLEFDSGLSEVIEVPRITSRFAQRALPMLKAVRYTYDLAFSISFYALNLTQFWVNTVPKLRGNLFEVYGSAVGGYTQMLMDFFRPSRWKYWRKRGVLTEIDNVIDLEFGTRGGADVLNLFAKLSEFNNRVAAALATERNIAMLAKHGKFETLYKELANSFSEEAETYAKNLADITQFRYGIEEKPVAFDNPIMDLYYQYNTFAIKQAELVEGMIRNVDLKEIWNGYKQAKQEGKTKEFVAELTQGQRAEFFRYILNVFILSAILGMAYVWKSAVKGIVPNQIEGVIDILKGLWDGDKDQMARGWKKFLMPPGYDLIEKVSKYGIKATIKNAKVFRQLNLISAALQGEGSLENIEGKTTEKVTHGVAIKRLLAPSTEKTAKANSVGWDLYFELQNSYDDTRKEALELIGDDKKDEARELVAVYNKKAKLKIIELTNLGVTDIRLKEQIEKGKKGFIVSESDFARWKKDAGKP